MLPMKIYPYLSDRREINETDVKYVETCNLRKVWDGSDSLNGPAKIFEHDGMRSLWDRGGEVRRTKDNFELFIFLDRSLS